MLIYIVRNRFNGKVYVGKHKGSNVKRRWKRHIKDADRGSDTYFHRAIRKYGSDNFELCLLSGYAFSTQDLGNQERFYIAKYRANESLYGYNLTNGGDGSGHVCPWKGQKLPESWRRNLGLALKGRKFTADHKQNLTESLKRSAKRGVESPHFGKPLYDETRQKISIANQGKVGPNKGKKFTAEHRRRMSEAKKGKIRGAFSDEHIKNLRLAAMGNQNAKGLTHSEEWKMTLSKRMKGNKYASKRKEHQLLNP